MTIYADVLFLMNFLFDAELLFLLCKIYSKKASVFRILLSAAVGGGSGVLVFIPFFEILSYPPAKVVIPAIMTAIVFYPGKIKTYLDAVLIFIGMSFFLSGAVHFAGIDGIWALLIPVPLYGIVSVIKKRTSRTRKSALLCYHGKTCLLDGFYDNGNMLSYCGTPVILGSRVVFEKLFGKGFSILALSEWVNPCDVRMIPYSALGKNGAVIGIKLDYARIDKKDYTGVVLAYSEKEFSEELILNSIMI